MGCQRAIARQIQVHEADYVLALKGNQETLHDEVRLFLETEAGQVRHRRDPGGLRERGCRTWAIETRRLHRAMPIIESL